jgi:two-component system NtrC family response regulator
MADHHLLVVDDEESQRTVLAGFLRKRGFDVTTATRADEAVSVVATRSVDLVLTDMKMPGMSGIELLDAIRRINPEVAVILMTAFGTVASAVEAMKRGAADFLTKRTGYGPGTGACTGTGICNGTGPGQSAGTGKGARRGPRR